MSGPHSPAVTVLWLPSVCLAHNEIAFRLSRNPNATLKMPVVDACSTVTALHNRSSKSGQTFRLALLLAAVVTLLAGATSARADDDAHLLIISIDGLRGEWSSHPEPTAAQTPQPPEACRPRQIPPTLCRACSPSVTYPSHTTLITAAASQHGILANVVFTPPTEKRRPKSGTGTTRTFESRHCSMPRVTPS